MFYISRWNCKHQFTTGRTCRLKHHLFFDEPFSNQYKQNHRDEKSAFHFQFLFCKQFCLAGTKHSALFRRFSNRWRYIHLEWRRPGHQHRYERVDHQQPVCGRTDIPGHLPGRQHLQRNDQLRAVQRIPAHPRCTVGDHEYELRPFQLVRPFCIHDGRHLHKGHGFRSLQLFLSLPGIADGLWPGLLQRE